jgi:hypothetical protein
MVKDNPSLLIRAPAHSLAQATVRANLSKADRDPAHLRSVNDLGGNDLAAGHLGGLLRSLRSLRRPPRCLPWLVIILDNWCRLEDTRGKLDASSDWAECADRVAVSGEKPEARLATFVQILGTLAYAAWYL